MQTPTENLQIEYVKIDALKPFLGNPRNHDDRNLSDIQRSIERFGWTNPILVRREDNMIVAGHGRLKAAESNGWIEVPVIYLDFSENDAKLYSITDNRTSETSEWSTERLSALIQELDTLPDIDLRDTGFDLEELDDYIDKLRDFEVENTDDFPEYDENIETAHRCPKCGYEWSGAEK